MKHSGKDSRIKYINRICAFISADIKSGSKRNDNSQNVFLEQNFIDIYNIAFGANFEKCKKINQPGIDIIDHIKKIGVQVTSEITSKKINHSFYQYFKHSDNIGISKLKFFFLSENLSKLPEITISSIEDYLNEDTVLSNINKSKAEKFTTIKISIDLFDINNDILCFDFINDKYHELDNKDLDKIIKILDEVLPFVKITTEDFTSYLSNKKLASINEKLDVLPKTEAITLIINTFLPLKIIPYHVLTTFHYSGQKIGYSVSEFQLVTDNKELYDDVIKETEAENKPLINFLLRNKINNIKLLGSNQYISIKKFYNTETTCNICNYDDFNLDNNIFFNSPKSDVSIDNIEELFYKAYFFAEYGKYQEAADQLQSIWNFFKKSESYNIARFITLYNLKRLKNSFYIRFKENSPLDKLPVLLQNEINRNFNIVVSDTITKEEQDVMDYFYHFKHINRQYETLELIQGTENAIIVESNGGFVQKDLGLEWYMTTFNAVYVSNHNLLLFDYKFSEISQIVFITFKSILSLSLFRHEKSIKPHLWDTFIKYTIKILSEPKLKDCLLVYNKKSPLFTEKENLQIFDSVLSKIINNIYLARHTLNEYLKSKSDKHCSLIDNLNQAFRNVCLYYKYLDLDHNQMNESLNKMLEIAEIPGLIIPYSHNLLIGLINTKQNVISKENSIRIKELYKTKPEVLNDLELYHSNFLDLSTFDYENASIDTLFDLWFYRKSEVDKEKLKIIYEQALFKSYNFNSLRLGVITDLIEFEPYKEQSVNYLTKIIKDRYDFNLNEWIVKSFLEIAYHQDLNLSLPEYQNLKPYNTKEEEYYTWLFNLSTYDYSKFNPYWLLKYPYDIFLIKFKTIPQVKGSLVQYLKINEDAKLSSIYFKYFL